MTIKQRGDGLYDHSEVVKLVERAEKAVRDTVQGRNDNDRR